VKVGRRALLRAGMVAVAVPVAACTAEPEPPPPPDPLAELAAQARADAAAAQAVAAGVPPLADLASQLAKARGEHAAALQNEVDRERPPLTSATSPPSTSGSGGPAPPADPAAAKTVMLEALTAAEKRAAELVPTLPRYRAGLVGSVAAGCASLREGLA
jgi:hypothetical protein